jgi:nucleotide-binding universal stress UspA family protein
VYKRILVPMENEQHQERALAHARALAQQTGAAVVLVWLVPVVASGEHFFTQIQVEPGSSGAQRKARGQEYLAQASQPFQAAGVDVVSKLKVTPLPPEQAIVELAVQEHADLIVMASLPQSAAGRFLFGSVGDKLRRRSPIPVLFTPLPQASAQHVGTARVVDGPAQGWSLPRPLTMEKTPPPGEEGGE